MKTFDNIYRVALFGHRDFTRYDILDTFLVDLIIDLIKEKDYVEIYIGRNGEFDVYAASVIKRVKRLLGGYNCELICALPYVLSDIDCYEKYYDSVQIFETPNSHPKGAINRRNSLMVEICDLVICYVECEYGGAYRAMKHALKLNKTVINLANMSCGDFNKN